MAANTVKIEGFEAVAREITKLADDRMKRLEILKILRRAVDPLKTAISAAAPTEEDGKDITIRGIVYPFGSLRDSISIFSGKNKEFINVHVGPATGKKGKADGFMGWWAEFGTFNRAPTRFSEKATAPLIKIVEAGLSIKLTKYIDRKAKTLNL